MLQKRVKNVMAACEFIYVMKFPIVFNCVALITFHNDRIK